MFYDLLLNVSEWVNLWVSELICRWVSEFVSELVKFWVSEVVSEWSCDKNG